MSARIRVRSCEGLNICKGHGSMQCLIAKLVDNAHVCDLTYCVLVKDLYTCDTRLARGTYGWLAFPSVLRCSRSSSQVVLLAWACAHIHRFLWLLRDHRFVPAYFNVRSTFWCCLYACWSLVWKVWKTTRAWCHELDASKKRQALSRATY